MEHALFDRLAELKETYANFLLERKKCKNHIMENECKTAELNNELRTKFSEKYRSLFTELNEKEALLTTLEQENLSFERVWLYHELNNKPLLSRFHLIGITFSDLMAIKTLNQQESESLADLKVLFDSDKEKGKKNWHLYDVKHHPIEEFEELKSLIEKLRQEMAQLQGQISQYTNEVTDFLYKKDVYLLRIQQIDEEIPKLLPELNCLIGVINQLPKD